MRVVSKHSIPDWFDACFQEFSLQAQLFGRGPKRSMQVARSAHPYELYSTPSSRPLGIRALLIDCK